MITQTAAGASSGLFQPAMQVWEAALRAGLRIQEESTRPFTAVLAGLGPPPWQKQAQTILTEAVHTAQENMDEAIRVIREGAKRNLEVFQKVLEAGQAQTAGEGQAAPHGVWETILKAIGAETQAIVQANARVLESWTELGKKVKDTMASRSP